MDEFDIYRARAYGGYVETPSGADGEFGFNGNVENEWPKRERERERERERSTRRRSFRNVSAELSADESESVAWADRSSHGGPPPPHHPLPPSRIGSDRKRTERTRTNSHVTVAVEPPSPTAEGGHQRSQSWKKKTADGPGGAPSTPEGPRGLHRTRTMPARRSVSPRRRSPLCPAVIVEPTPESPTTSPPGSSADEVTGECRIYRVRSFTTKKGGVVVNRGDSIKICNARRASRCDSLLLAPTGGGDGASRVCSSTGRSSLQPFHPSPCQTRRSSASCLVVEPTGLTGSRDGDGGQGGAAQRASCRNIAYEGNQDDLPPLGAEAPAAAISPRRKASTVSPAVDRTGGFGVRLVGPEEEDLEDTLNEGSGFRLNGPTEADDGEDDECEDADAAGSEELVYKVAVVGSNGVGKTTLIHQLLTSEYLANKENYQDETDHSEKIVSVQLDDVESMVHFEDASLSEEPIKDCDEVDAYLVVYSVTDRSSFAYCQSCLQEIGRRRRKDTTATMVVANKQDLVRNRMISEGEGKRLAAKRRSEFLEVSALLDHRVDEVLVTVIRLIRHLRSRWPNAGGVAGGGGGGGGGAGGRIKGRGTSSDDELLSSRGCIYKAASAIIRKLFK